VKRLLGIVLLLAFGLLLPVAPAGAQTGAGPTTVQGTVTDDTGSPVANASVSLTGTSSASGKTDAKGRFAFANVPSGVYTITVVKGGYQTTTISDQVAYGGTVSIPVTLHGATLTTLRNIGTVKATRQGNFNTSTASVNVVTAQTFQDQGATQVTQVLNQVPGVQISFPGSSANGASPGAITFPNIRNGLSYETATLIDGHPLSVGLYGDYVTTFLNPYLLGDAEIIKGPGAMAPQVNYAINGTVNFRTKDPTPDAETFYTVGASNYNAGVFAFGVSDTIGRLGFVVGIAGLDDPSAIRNEPVYFDPGSGSGFTYVPGATTEPANFYPYGCNALNPLNKTSPTLFYSRAYNTCSVVATSTVSGDYNNLAELLKLRYKIGDRTFFTASYFGSQTTSNQSGNTSELVQSTFTPGAGYHGPLAPGTPIDVLLEPYDAQPQFETNNEPIFQAELSTAINNDTVVARYYHATIERLQTAGNGDAFNPYPQVTNVYGTDQILPSPAPPTPFNGQTAISQYNYYNEPEIDKLGGWSFEYTHPFSDSNEVSFAVDNTVSTSVNYYQEVGFDGSQCQLGSYQGSYCFDTSTAIPSGASQNFTTWHLRDRAQITSKFAATLALYENTYRSTYPTNCTNNFVNVDSNGYQTTCLPNGTLDTWEGYKAPYSFVSNVPVNFQTNTTAHFDERLGLEWRPQQSVAVRFSAGSSIAPPFLDLLSEANGISYNPEKDRFAVQTINSGTLHAETAFGYDLGGDYAFHDGVTFASTDFYLTNLFGQFLNQTYPIGTCPVSACGATGIPLYAQTNLNLSNARYEGIELGIKRVPQVGWGFSLSGSTQRGYPYDLPPNFYCGNASNAITVKCIPGKPSTYNTNLSIISGQNYTGEFINSTGSTTYGVSNQSVPYLQGNAEVSYHFRNGAFVLFGDTLYGKNNSLNEPPFGLAYASINYPVTPDVAIQVSGTNIFNAYSGLFPIFGGGVTVPLVNGQSAGTVGNVLGPARYLFLITKAIGPAPSVTPPPFSTNLRQNP
jgi:hypothetical protein